MAVIHSAYYAMFHGARAVLLRATGSAPRKHDSVVTAFGRLVRDGDESLRRCGRWLNAMKTDERPPITARTSTRQPTRHIRRYGSPTIL